jgi:TRAP-type C4-dicarboxylate transport system substrate-binding protein
MLRATLFLLLGIAGIAHAAAQEAVTLKVADYLPAGHFVATQGLQVFLSKATELSGGKLKFQYFPAQQLGRAEDLLSLTQSGVADIAFIAPSFVPDRLPLSVVDELPGMYETSCAGTHAFQTLTLPGGLLDTLEFKPNGVRVLFSVALSPYTVQTSHRKVATLDDMAGLKIYTAGGAKEATLRALGAVPVRMAAPEAYQAVQRGTVDGVLLSFLSLRPYDLNSLVKYAFVGVDLGSAGPIYAISERIWSKLTPDLQAALTEAGRTASAHLCAYSDQNEAAELTKLETEGMLVTRLSDSEKARFGPPLLSVQDAWAQSLEQRGKPAKSVLSAFKAAVPGVPGPTSVLVH